MAFFESQLSVLWLHCKGYPGTLWCGRQFPDTTISLKLPFWETSDPRGMATSTDRVVSMGGYFNRPYNFIVTHYICC